MLNKDKIIEMYQQETYYRGIIVGSAALVMHGLLEEARDLDVAISKGMMAYHEGEQDLGAFAPARYHAGGEDGFDFVGLNFVECDEIDGIPVATLQHMLTFYEAVGREKDHDKIALIEDVLFAKPYTHLRFPPANLPEDCDVSMPHLLLHINSATAAIGEGDLLQIHHDLQIASEIVRQMLVKEYESAPEDG